MRRFFGWAGLLIFLALGAAPGGAQTPATVPADAASFHAGPAETGPSSAPADVLTPTPEGVQARLGTRARRTLMNEVGAPASLLPQARDRRGIPFMAAGGALFVAGAIIGDTAGTLLMVGGAGAGAFGLFVYFGGDPE